jgi:hypothetical protein
VPRAEYDALRSLLHNAARDGLDSAGNSVDQTVIRAYGLK